MEHISQKGLKCQIKAKIYRSNPGFGPGIADIMELVRKTENLSEAYRTMGLSSSKGWKIIKRAEEDLGFPLIISIVGGSGGGKSVLSKEGEIFLQRYQDFMEELDIEVERLFKKYFYDY